MGAWIEITVVFVSRWRPFVAPHVGAWIEIIKGLWKGATNFVAPHVGAWIEISYWPQYTKKEKVAPHVGAWIEISRDNRTRNLLMSHPTWVRGLKFNTQAAITTAQ